MNDLHWVAGLLEGEGSFILDRGYPRVMCNMTDLDVLERVQRILGGQIYVTPSTLRPPGRKQQYAWRVSKQSTAIGIMLTLYPMMGVRRQERIRQLVLSWTNRKEAA